MRRHIRKYILILLILLLALQASACGKDKDAIDYTDKTNWAFYGEEDETKNCDLFMIAPCVDLGGTKGRLNMSMTDADTKQKFVGAMNMQLGIFTDKCAVYAPYYRQMTMLVYTDSDEKNAAARQRAVKDVLDSFEEYLDNLDDGEPIVLAGYFEGGEMVLEIMKRYGEKISDRLVAAYILGWAMTEDDLSEYIVPATGATDTGVFVSFVTEAPSIRSSIIVPAGKKAISINPLNWKTDGTTASKSFNKGAAFPDYSGYIEQKYPTFTGAYIDQTRGTLKVTDVDPNDFPPQISSFAEGVYYQYEFQFFYENLKQNVSARISSYESTH